MRTTPSTLLCWLLLIGCGREARASEREPARAANKEPSPGAVSSAPVKPDIVKGALPVAPFVAEQLLQGPQGRTLVYVGASWCEPCQRFHRALHAGELDAALPGTRFLEYDYDATGKALEADGYSFKYLPFFALPRADGHCSSRSMQGSIKGPRSVDDNLVPRLHQLLSTR